MSRGRLFDRVASLYDDVRPNYPQELYDVLAQATGGLRRLRVLDLAAGPGIATRALVERSARVTAVDVGPDMMRTLRLRSPDVPAVVATGEVVRVLVPD